MIILSYCPYWQWMVAQCEGHKESWVAEEIQESFAAA